MALQLEQTVPDGAAAPLGTCDSYSFADWPNAAVPQFGAGVYTIWDAKGRLLYVGMSGRSITDQTARRNNAHGLHTRLANHASGRRSGDQFCVYVAGRLMLPTLSASDIAAISSGEHQMDGFVRRHIHENLRYRLAIWAPGAKSREAAIALAAGLQQLWRVTTRLSAKFPMVNSGHSVAAWSL